MTITTEKLDQSIVVTRRDDGLGDPVVVTTTMPSTYNTLIEVRLSDGEKRIQKISFYIPHEHARLFAEQILTNMSVFEEESK